MEKGVCTVGENVDSVGGKIHASEVTEFETHMTPGQSWEILSRLPGFFSPTLSVMHVGAHDSQKSVLPSCQEVFVDHSVM